MTQPVKFYHTIGDTRELVFRCKVDGVPYPLSGSSVSAKLTLTKYDDEWSEAIVVGADMSIDPNQVVNAGVCRFDWSLTDMLPDFDAELYRGRVETNVDGEQLTFPTADYGEEYFIVVVNEPLPSGAATTLLPDPTIIRRIYDDFTDRDTSRFNFLGASGASWSSFNPFDPFTGSDAMRTLLLDEANGAFVSRLGTSASGRADIVHQQPAGNCQAIGRGIGYRYTTRVAFLTLPTPTNRYIFINGFFDGDTVDPEYNRGLLFTYRDDENGGKIKALCRSAAGGANVTEFDTGITPETMRWYVFSIEVEPDASEVRFYIDRQLVARSNSNIASGHSNYYTVEINNDRVTTDGVTNPYATAVDYYWLDALRTDSRS